MSVSGDGLFHEVLNGLASRDDWEKVLSFSWSVKKSKCFLASGKKNRKYSCQPYKESKCFPANLKRIVNLATLVALHITPVSKSVDAVSI